jgi:hypothetical protein
MELEIKKDENNNNHLELYCGASDLYTFIELNIYKGCVLLYKFIMNELDIDEDLNYFDLEENGLVGGEPGIDVFIEKISVYIYDYKTRLMMLVKDLNHQLLYDYCNNNLQNLLTLLNKIEVETNVNKNRIYTEQLYFEPSKQHFIDEKKLSNLKDELTDIIEATNQILLNESIKKSVIKNKLNPPKTEKIKKEKTVKGILKEKELAMLLLILKDCGIFTPLSKDTLCEKLSEFTGYGKDNIPDLMVYTNSLLKEEKEKILNVLKDATTRIKSLSIKKPQK